MKVGKAASLSGWSPRMLRYLERVGLIVPERTAKGYRLYGLRELNLLRALRDLRARHVIELADVVFAARLRSEPDLRAAVETWLAGASGTAPAYLEWEQRKQERLLAA
jgi:MerR family transcriptional regulator, copper efflux regulator